MEKVRIVCKTKERSRVTSFGVLEFDSEGKSVEYVDRASAEAIVKVSKTLFIEGEEFIKEDQFGAIGIPKSESDDKTVKKEVYTEEELEVELVKQGERLISEISKSLGLKEEYVNEQLMSPLYPSEPNSLIPTSVYNELISDSRTKKELNLEPASKANVEGTKEFNEANVQATSQEEIDEMNQQEYENPAGSLQKEETDEESDTDKDSLNDRRAGLEQLKMEELRDILKEAGVEESEWKGFKGQEGKVKLIDLILKKSQG